MKKKLHFILPILFITLQVNAQSTVDSLKYIIEREVTNRRSISITAGVIEANNKKVISSGKVDKSKKAIPDGNTVYEIGSITKLFTSLLLADMVVKKQINLDDPISKFLPATVKAPARDGKEITLRSLATHKSGLPDLLSGINKNPGIIRNSLDKDTVTGPAIYNRSSFILKVIGTGYIIKGVITGKKIFPDKAIEPQIRFAAII